MKNLWLVRHAKSHRDYHFLPDFDRPLNERGYRDAEMMAKRLLAVKFRPDHIVTSPAVRAVSTAFIFARVLKFPFEKIQLASLLYDSDVDEYLEVIGEFSNEKSSVMLFGHNPVITDVVNHLAQERIDNIPTTGIANIVFNKATWADAAGREGKLASFDFPKRGS